MNEHSGLGRALLRPWRWAWLLAIALSGVGCTQKEGPPGGGSPDGGSQSSATGTWAGSVSFPGTAPVGVRFTLADQNGQLTGQTYFEDPATGAYLRDAELTGTRNGADESWQTSTGLIVHGTFNANGFTGTLEFPADDPLAFHVVDVVLTR